MPKSSCAECCCRLEGFRLEVAEQALTESTALDRAHGLVEIGCADQQFSFAHLCLKHKSKAVVTLHVVNHLNDRTVICGEVVEDHW